MKPITTNDALKPSGHYAQAMVHGDLVYLSGQLPFDCESGEPVHGTAAEQAACTLRNIGRILQAAGTDKSKVVRCTIYTSDIAYWDEINTVYAAFFGDHKPARVVVPTGPLHFDFKVEIEAIAALS